MTNGVGFVFNVLGIFSDGDETEIHIFFDQCLYFCMQDLLFLDILKNMWGDIVLRVPFSLKDIAYTYDQNSDPKFKKLRIVISFNKHTFSSGRYWERICRTIFWFLIHSSQKGEQLLLAV